MDASIGEIIAKAKRLEKGNKRWHFHMLGRSCMFNRARGRFAIALESGDGPLVCVFGRKPLGHSLKLAKISYGGNFLAKAPPQSRNPAFARIIGMAKESASAGKDWHHHHLPPYCMFNRHKGKHSIVFESDKCRLEALYGRKPMGDLAKLERLFYKKARKA